MTAVQLAAGTNWTPNTPSMKVTVTEPSRNLWQPQ